MNRKSGFSLIELIIVIGVIGIMAAIGAYSWQRYVSNTNLRTAARELVADFNYMKANAETVTPLGGVLWEGGAQTFINKGTNGRWKDVLTPAEVRAYEQRALRELGEDCAAWLVDGGRLD